MPETEVRLECARLAVAATPPHSSREMLIKTAQALYDFIRVKSDAPAPPAQNP